MRRGKVKLLEVGECALKIYWKANIIKNFFYCILHASFQSLVRCRSVVDSSIMELPQIFAVPLLMPFYSISRLLSYILIILMNPVEPSRADLSFVF